MLIYIEFFQLAGNYLDIDKHKVENFLIDLETKSKKLEQQLRDANLENTRLTGLADLYQKNIDKLNNEKKEIIRKTKDDAEVYLRGVNSKIEKVIKELKESNASSEVIKQSQVLVKTIKEENRNIFKEDRKVGKE